MQWAKLLFYRFLDKVLSVPNVRHTMRYLSALLIFASTTIYGGEYVGIVFPPFPTEVEDLGSVLINYQTGSEVEWSVNLVQIGAKKHLWLNRFEERKNKNAYFRLRHQLTLPDTRNGEYIYLSLCKSSGSNELNITGIGSGPADEEWHIKITSAYKPNLNTGLLESMSPVGVACYNEGYGV
ncbi:MAG: hypothetical protein R6W86_17155 [Marinobacter sp.]|uniref:hypothetical protein n=1 Tax=Marinobacter sp. TaxID=50741 RepID=UPI00396E5636